MILRQNPQTLAYILSKVFKNFTIFEKQEQALQFPATQVGRIR